MVYVLHGADGYSMRVFLEALREAAGPADVRDASTTVVAARDATPALILGLGSTVPFLSERRLVVVEGLLASVEGTGRGAGRARAREGPGPMAQWQGFADSLEGLPPTTDLVFLDGPLRTGNPLLRELSRVAQVREFRPPTGEALHQWVRQEAARRGGDITPGSARLLADLVGPDLWTLSNELEKLGLYAVGRPIEEADVQEMVSLAREARVFAAVDAVLEGTHRGALRLVHRLLDGGATVPYLLTMLARQVRRLILAQELLRERTPSDEVGRRLGISSAYPLRKTIEQARATPSATLRHLHAALLDTDVAIKTGAMEERLALESLVAWACTRQVRRR